MLRKIRITLAIVFFALVSMLFLDFTGTIHAWFGWMAKIQFFPAVMALNAGVIIAVLVLTLLLGACLLLRNLSSRCVSGHCVVGEREA